VTGVGVLDHRPNPTTDEIVALARRSEEAGADWLTLSDFSTWRDVWMMTTLAAQVTESMKIGPGVTNPYLRHPWHTVAALATLHDLSGGRAMLGVGAGGSALTDSGGIARGSAPQRVGDLIRLVRGAAGGAALDPATGHELGVPLPDTPVLVAGRKDGMLRCAGAHGDSALVFRIPQSDLARAVGVINDGALASGRTSGPDIVWCPLVAWDERIRPFLRAATVYSMLESPPELFERWGLDAETRGRIRSTVSSGGIAAAADMVPDVVAADIILPDADPASVAKIGRSVGATAIAIRNFDTEAVGVGVGWAREVASLL
jgi:5,10-methylenetetrahydromethanopterin reductase